VKSVTGVKAGESARAYVSQASYDSGGGLDRALLGNGRWEDRDYNERKQVISIKLGSTQGAGDLLTLGFGYGTTNNNGNVLSQTIARPGFSATQTYTYDAYNRIQKVQEGTDFRDFAYKEPGNLYVPSWSAGAGWAPGSFTPVSASWFDGNNRMVNTGLGIGYDAAGNQTAIGGFTFAYDAENRLVSSTLNGVTTTYAYDGEGRRVKKTTGGSAVIFVYDAFGRLAAEYGGTADPVGTECLTADHLGSTRLITSSTGAERRCLDYLPFGEQMTQGMGGRGSCYADANEPRVKFTGKERDAETGLDYFGARYFSGAQGRFTSPDVPLADQWETEPQSWNLYSHVRNNPLRFIDPTGRKCVTLDNGTVGDDGQGKMCQAVLDAEKNKKPDVTVSAKGGSQVVAFALNLLFALDSAANSYFTPLTNAMGVRPSYMEPIPVTREFVGQLAAAVVTVGTAIIGPGGAQAPLKLIHSPATLSKTILDGLRKKSTQELIESLRPGLPEALRVKPDGRVMNGNHRLTVLMERGVDVNALPREVVP